MANESVCTFNLESFAKLFRQISTVNFFLMKVLQRIMIQFQKSNHYVFMQIEKNYFVYLFIYVFVHVIKESYLENGQCGSRTDGQNNAPGRVWPKSISVSKEDNPGDREDEGKYLSVDIDTIYHRRTVKRFLLWRDCTDQNT